MKEVKIIRSDVMEEGVLMLSGAEGRMRRILRPVLRWLGLMKRERVLDLFQANMVAFRFWTDDGRCCIVPVTREMVNDAALDVPAYARRMAVRQLGSGEA